MAALYDGNGDRIFRLDYRKNDEYVSNKAGTAENVYYPSGSVNSAYDTDVILNEMLIPNGVTNNTAINYELTGYINDINSEYTQVLTEFGANGNTTNIYEYGDGRNSATINGTKGYYLYDGRGSVAGLTGNTGGSMITYRYDAYGNTTRSNNTLNNPYQYNAEYTDSSTGLQYLRARYYDSSQGRFTAKDTLLGSIEKPITRNLYTYCGNNPLNYVDPSGHLIIPGSKTANHMPIITPISQQQINREVRKIITDPFSPGMTILNPTERKAYYDKRIENIYGNYAYGPSYSNPTGPYRYDPVKNPFGQGKNASKRAEAQTVLQKHIAKVQEENYKKYCENGTPKAKDDGTSPVVNVLAGILGSSIISGVKIKDFTNGIGAAIGDNATNTLFSFLNNLTGNDISFSDIYTPIDEQAFQAGKIAGDIISVVIGAVSTIEGLATIYSSINIAAGGALVTATGVGAAPGGVVVAVSGVGVVVGTAELGAGIALITGGLGNLSDDIQNYNSSRITNPTKGESPIWKNLDNVKGSDRKTSGTGKNKRYYEWDNTHNDIEVYDKNGKHLGSMDPTTGEMYKPAVPGRTITIN